MSRSGRFITFEGGEGTGKSTQVLRLAGWLRGHGTPVVTTREPGGSPHAEAIRDLLLTGRVAPFGAGAEAILFAVARADHVAATIRPALQSGSWVICDRFVDSTRAYQGTAGVDPAEIERLERIAVGETMPDLTIILDLAAEAGLLRAAGRHAAADRFEADGTEVHEARRQAFLAIAAREPKRCVVVDAGPDEETIAAEIRNAVSARFGPGSA